MYLILSYLAFYIIIELDKYQWNWSSNSSILALQYMIYTIWISIAVLSPFWVFFIPITINNYLKNRKLC